MDVLYVFLAGLATALATGLGAIPVWLLGARTRELLPVLWGLTIGLMTVASILGLLKPAFDEGSAGAVAAGFAVGVGFLLGSRRWLGHHEFAVDGHDGDGVRRAILVFGVLFVHSLPEGFAVGTAYASSTAGLGLYVILAIALQNVPEGTSVAIPMEAEGFSRSRQFWAAVGTSLPQPVGAVIAFLLVEEITSLLSFSFAFAAGAMLALVVIELVPVAFRRGTVAAALLGTAIGGAIMGALAVTLGV